MGKKRVDASSRYIKGKVPETRDEVPSMLLENSGQIPKLFKAAGEKALASVQRFFRDEVPKKTRSFAGTAVKTFALWCEGQCISLYDLNDSSASNYRAYLQTQFRPVTVSHYLGYLRRLFDVLVAEKVVQHNSINCVSKPLVGVGKKIEWKIPSANDASSVPPFISNAGQKAVQCFCDYFSTLGDAEHCRDVAYSLINFCRWCESKEMKLKQLRAGAFVDYAKELAPKYAATTIQNRIRYLSELCDWFVQHKIIRFNPVTKSIIPLPQRNDRILQLPSMEEVEALIGSIETKTVGGLRDRAIISLMAYALAMPRDLVEMKVKDFFMREGSWWLRYKHRLVRELPANSKVVDALQAYIEAAGMTGEEDNYLFLEVSRNAEVILRKRMAAHGFSERVRQRSIKAGLSKKLKPLSIRGAGIKAFLEGGGTIEKAMGITGLTMTGMRSYTGESTSVVMYEGDLDGLIGFLDTSSSQPLSEFVKRSKIFRLTVEEDSNTKKKE